MKFVASRLVRRSDDLVFEIAPSELAETAAANKPDFGDGTEIFLIDKDNLHDPNHEQVLAQALKGEDAVYRDELLKHACMLAVTERDTLIHVTFVQFETSYKKLLCESSEVPLIGNCWTAAEARGRGIYPRALKMMCATMASRGFKRVAISCAPDNHASIAGINKAGFKEIRAVTSFIVLTKLALQIVRQQGRQRIEIALL